MPLDVSNVLRVDPESISVSGGAVRTTFEAAAVGGPTRLRADYRLAAPTPYQIAGPASLEADVFALRPFPQTLTLVLAGDPSGVTDVRIVAAVREVGVAGGPVVESRGRVFVQAAAAAPGAAAPGAPVPADLAGRLKAFRAARGLSQAQLAEELDVSASTVSRLENGQPPSPAIRQRLAALGVAVEG